MLYESRKFIRRVVPETSTAFEVPPSAAAWWYSGSAVDMDFVNNRYHDSTLGLVNASDELTCSRSSTSYAKNSSGTWVSFAPNVLRITDLGLLIEGAGTNYLLNSDTPATQTTGDLSTGNYCLWVEGSGDATTSAGTATITGAGTATEGSPNLFAVTASGTVVVTVSGALTRFQLEKAPSGATGFPTSYIPTGAVTAARAEDFIQTQALLASTYALAAVSNLIDIKILSYYGETFRIVCNNLAYPALYVDTDTQIGMGNGVTYNTQPLGGSVTLTGGAKVASSWDSTPLNTLVGGGGAIGGDNALFSFPQTYIGGFSEGGTSMYGRYRRITVWNSKLNNTLLQSLTAP